MAFRTGFGQRRQALLQLELERMLPILTKMPEVRQVILFGSLARGGIYKASDIDLLVVAASDEPFTPARSVNCARTIDHCCRSRRRLTCSLGIPCSRRYSNLYGKGDGPAGTNRLQTVTHQYVQTALRCRRDTPRVFTQRPGPLPA